MPWYLTLLAPVSLSRNNPDMSGYPPKFRVVPLARAELTTLFEFCKLS